MQLRPNYKEYTLEQLIDVKSAVDSEKYPDRAAEIEKLIAEKADSPTDTIDAIDITKRPKWVWVISVFYVFSILFTFYSYYLVLSGQIVLPVSQKNIFTSFGSVYWGFVVISSALTLSAVITLFLLKKVTINLWKTVFVLGVISNTYYFLISLNLNAFSASSVFGIFGGLAITYAIYAYTKRLEFRGYFS